MDRLKAGGVLGLFPTFEATGGIEASGQAAWEGVARDPNSKSQNKYLFCYTNGRRIDGGNIGTSTLYASSKSRAVIAALRARWAGRLILVWHLGLLKLLPFFRTKEARVVLFLHGIEAWGHQDWLTRTLLRRVDLFLSNSDYTWQRFVRAHPRCARAAHQTVHLGIASPLSGNITAPGIPPVALMISRLAKSEDYKGHREMIDIWPAVLKHAPDAELWIAGDGDLRERLEQLVAERGLQSKVRFWGWVSEAKKQELLAHCRCLALPSRGEGFGLVYLEAMRMGRPCLVSTTDAGREVVNPPEAGLAADSAQPKLITDAICQLLISGPRWDAWSAQARRRYETHFTTKHFQDRLLSALATVF